MASFREQRSTENFEKRRIPRFPVQLPAQLGDVEDLSSICTDLSSEGLSIETSQDVHVGQRLTVKVVVAHSGSPLRMLGQVMWKKDSAALDPHEQKVCEVGIRFVKPLPDPWKMPADMGSYSSDPHFLYEDREKVEDSF